VVPKQKVVFQKVKNLFPKREKFLMLETGVLKLREELQRVKCIPKNKIV